ncbi:MAG: hypothetical protein KAX65_08330 [Caldilineaceae bacterium]|nr:hypothetical protein [Caldilineaceae bacterium]
MDEQATVEGKKAQAEALARTIVEDYEKQQFDAMGNLHNRFVGYIAESGVPLRNVILVLELLLREAVDTAQKQYMGH